jgi:hypothetical protein
MSAVRTLLTLQDALADEFVWRRKELHSLKSMVAKHEKTSSRDLSVRTAVPLLYAHWEGFVKKIGSLYLEFVARQGLKNRNLAKPFLAMAVGRLVHDMAASNKVKQSMEVVDFFLDRLSDSSNLQWRGGVNTKANLNSTVLQEIVLSLGLDYTPFETKEKMIDVQLLGNRNNIAHGRYALVSHGEFMALHGEVLGLMQEFYNQVESAAIDGTYKDS